jgi:hypothetical protein
VSSSEAATLLEARAALASLDRARQALNDGIRRGVTRDERRRLMAERSAAVERLEAVPQWALDEVRGLELARLYVNNHFGDPDGAARLIAWAERRSI